jgi:hypothetical protein
MNNHQRVMRITITTLALLLAFVLGARAQEQEYISFYDGATTHYVGYNPSGDDIVTLDDYNGHNVFSFTLNNRTLFKDGSWNTLCLPFNYAVDGDVLNGAEVRTLSSSSFDNGKLTINFSAPVSMLQAGVPYIIKWVEDSDIKDPVFAMNSTVKLNTTLRPVTTDCVDFVGNYTPVTLDANDRTKLYLGSENTLYYPSSDVTIGFCRAHFVLKNISVGNVTKAIMFFGDDEATKITTTNFTNGTNSDNRWYTLDGRCIPVPSDASVPSVLPKGVYIHNGVKVAIK